MNNRFNEAAGSWDAKPDRLIMAEKFASEIKRVIKDKNYKSALEYGCGTGNVSVILKDVFEKVTLADASEGMLDEVQKKKDQNSLIHFHPVLLDLEKEKLREKFDLIYTLMTLHHVKNILNYPLYF